MPKHQHSLNLPIWAPALASVAQSQADLLTQQSLSPQNLESFESLCLFLRRPDL